MTHERLIRVATDHPAFAGHFPGRPILPGVVVLGWALETLAEALDRPATDCDVASAKFLRPVAPGAELLFRLARDRAGSWRFDVFDKGAAVATGVLRPREA